MQVGSKQDKRQPSFLLCCAQVDHCNATHVDHCNTIHVDNCNTPQLANCNTLQLDHCNTLHLDHCNTLQLHLCILRFATIFPHSFPSKYAGCQQNLSVV
mmetsp:Transcript_42676/g.68534  ORF Transcript_42676/g.68534 Transcript_42676/m.68534 type:complete len:99 (+) Transcript_42676:147-443(+)